MFFELFEDYIKDSPVAVQRLARQFPYTSKTLHADLACIGITNMGTLHLRCILDACPNLACLERLFYMVPGGKPTLRRNSKGFFRSKCEDYLLKENFYNRNYLYLYIRYLAKQYLSGNIHIDDDRLQSFFIACKYLSPSISHLAQGDIRSIVFATYWFPVDDNNNSDLFFDNYYFSPETKFLVMLRNPVDTLYSIYKHCYVRLEENFEKWINFDFIRNCVENNSFPDIQEIYMRFPQYRSVLVTYSLKHYFKRFNPEQFYFIPNTLLLKNVTYLIKKLSNILNIREWKYDNSKIYSTDRNWIGSKGFNFPKISDPIFSVAEKFFQHYNSDFDEIISHSHIIADKELFFSRSTTVNELLEVNTDIISEQGNIQTKLESILLSFEGNLQAANTGLCLFFFALHLQLYGYALRICELYKELLPKNIECFVTLALIDAKTSDTNLTALRKDMLARLLNMRPPMRTQGYVRFESKVLLKKCARKFIDDLLHGRFGTKTTVAPAVDTACAFEASREKVALQCAAVPVDPAVSAEMRALALESDLETGQYVFRKFFDRHFQTKFLHKLAELC